MKATRKTWMSGGMVTFIKDKEIQFKKGPKVQRE